jgi:TPR repeat protein
MKAVFGTLAAFCLAVALSAVAGPAPTVDLDGLRRNAGAGDRVAQYNLGVLLEKGQLGVAEDKTQAVEWYRKSADQGYANAQYNLGVLYLRGEGVAPDRQAAIHWLQSAAVQHHQPAQAALEKLGVAVPQSSAEN